MYNSALHEAVTKPASADEIKNILKNPTLIYDLDEDNLTVFDVATALENMEMMLVLLQQAMEIFEKSSSKKWTGVKYANSVVECLEKACDILLSPNERMTPLPKNLPSDFLKVCHRFIFLYFGYVEGLKSFPYFPRTKTKRNESLEEVILSLCKNTVRLSAKQLNVSNNEEKVDTANGTDLIAIAIKVIYSELLTYAEAEHLAIMQDLNNFFEMPFCAKSLENAQESDFKKILFCLPCAHTAMVNLSVAIVLPPTNTKVSIDWNSLVRIDFSQPEEQKNISQGSETASLEKSTLVRPVSLLEALRKILDTIKFGYVHKKSDNYKTYLPLLSLLVEFLLIIPAQSFPKQEYCAFDKPKTGEDPEAQVFWLAEIYYRRADVYNNLYEVYKDSAAGHTEITQFHRMSMKEALVQESIGLARETAAYAPKQHELAIKDIRAAVNLLAPIKDKPNTYKAFLMQCYEAYMNLVDLNLPNLNAAEVSEMLNYAIYWVDMDAEWTKESNSGYKIENYIEQLKTVIVKLSWLIREMDFQRIRPNWNLDRKRELIQEGALKIRLALYKFKLYKVLEIKGEEKAAKQAWQESITLHERTIKEIRQMLASPQAHYRPQFWTDNEQVSDQFLAQRKEKLAGYIFKLGIAYAYKESKEEKPDYSKAVSLYTQAIALLNEALPMVPSSSFLASKNSQHEKSDSAQVLNRQFYKFALYNYHIYCCSKDDPALQAIARLGWLITGIYTARAVALYVNPVDKNIDISIVTFKDIEKISVDDSGRSPVCARLLLELLKFVRSEHSAPEMNRDIERNFKEKEHNYYLKISALTK